MSEPHGAPWVGRQPALRLRGEDRSALRLRSGGSWLRTACSKAWRVGSKRDRQGCWPTRCRPSRGSAMIHASEAGAAASASANAIVTASAMLSASAMMRWLRCGGVRRLGDARWMRGADGVLDVFSTPGRLFFRRLRARARRVADAVAVEALILVEVLSHLLRRQLEALADRRRHVSRLGARRVRAVRRAIGP